MYSRYIKNYLYNTEEEHSVRIADFEDCFENLIWKYSQHILNFKFFLCYGRKPTDIRNKTDFKMIKTYSKLLSNSKIARQVLSENVAN